MRTVEEIVEEAKLLSPPERLQLIEQLGVLIQDKDVLAKEARFAALETFLALAGTAETDWADVASDKSKHLAEIYSDHHERM